MIILAFTFFLKRKGKVSCIFSRFFLRSIVTKNKFPWKCKFSVVDQYKFERKLPPFPAWLILFSHSATTFYFRTIIVVKFKNSSEARQNYKEGKNGKLGNGKRVKTRIDSQLRNIRPGNGIRMLCEGSFVHPLPWHRPMGTRHVSICTISS